MNPCPPYRKNLALLAAEVLEGAQRDQLLAHTADCPACRHYLSQLTEVCREHAVAAERWPALEPSPGFHRRLAERLRDEASTAEKRSLARWIVRMRGLRWRLALPVAGAAVVLMALALWDPAFRRHDPLINPATESGPQPAIPSTHVWLAYQLAANQSYEAIDALLARDTTMPSPGSDHITAGMRELSGWTE